MARWLALTVLLLSSWPSPGGLRAQADSSEIDLGGGLRVRRIPRYCPGGSTVTGCFAWEPVGFSFGSEVGLSFARTFARVEPNGRILAALPLASSLYAPFGVTTRMLRTDDLGEHWIPVPWRWVESVAIMVFDAGTDDGVAAGDSGYLWATTDGGLTWTEHGNAAGTTYTELAMRDSVVVARDSAGNVWRAPHGNFDRELIVTDPTAHLTTEGDSVLVRTERDVFRLRRGHAVERTRR